MLLIVSCSKTDKFENQSSYSLETSTKMAREIVEGAPSCFGHIKSDKVTNLAQGVSLLDLSYLNRNGYSTRMLLYKVILGTADFKVTMPDDVNTLGSLQPLTAQAKAMDGNNIVLGAVNGDTWSASNNQPTGILYRDGAQLKDSFSDASSGFFAILNDGNAIIGTREDYSGYKARIRDAIGTRVRILDKGYPVVQTDTKLAARTFVAVDEYSSTVWAGVVDGVYFYYSNGISIEDLSTILKAAGAYNAALLDSGSSTTLIVRNDLADEVIQLGNSPADNGIEKAVVNGLAIIQK